MEPIIDASLALAKVEALLAQALGLAVAADDRDRERMEYALVQAQALRRLVEAIESTDPYEAER